MIILVLSAIILVYPYVIVMDFCVDKSIQSNSVISSKASWKRSRVDTPASNHVSKLKSGKRFKLTLHVS